MNQLFISAVAGLSVLFGDTQTRVCPPLLTFLGLSSWIPLVSEELKIRSYFLNRVHWKNSSMVSSYSIAIVPSSDLKQWIISDITNLDVIDPNVLRDKASSRYIACRDMSRMATNEAAQTYKGRLFVERECMLEMHDFYPLKNMKKEN